MVARILITGALVVAALTATVVVANAQLTSSDEKKTLDTTNKIMRALQTGALPTVSGLPPAETFRHSSLGDDLTKMLRTERVTSPLGRRARSGEGLGPKFIGPGGIKLPDFKAVVRIKFRKDKSSQEETCTGVVLHDDEIVGMIRVLTAAHCSCGLLNSYRIFLNNIREEDGRFFELGSLPERYADYTCLLPPEAQPGRDLALLSIRFNKEPNAVIQLLSSPLIATVQQVFEDANTRQLVGVGYGRTETGELPITSVAVAIPIQSYFCADGFFAASVCASFREFVLGDASGGRGSKPPPDSCGGDSGAPIFWVPSLPANGSPDLSGVRFLVGITSRGLAGVRHIPGIRCGGGGLYTAVGHPDVVRWLSANSVFARTRFFK